MVAFPNRKTPVIFYVKIIEPFFVHVSVIVYSLLLSSKTNELCVLFK